MKMGSIRQIKEVYIGLIQACGGPDVPDEAMSPPLQVSGLRLWAEQLKEALQNENAWDT